MQHSDESSPPDRRERVRQWLRSRRLPLVAAGLAIALCAPALWAGLQTEDYLQGERARASPWLTNLFGSPHVSPWTNYTSKDSGFLPWIASPHLNIAFWRPLASLTHQLDWALWPAHPWLMHLHSLLWLVAAVLISAALYRRLLEPPWVAGLATLMFAVTDAHGFAVSWIANRNALVGAVFALLALLAYDAWRRRGFWPGGLLAPLCLSLGLAGNELAVGVAGYLVAHALLLDRARWHRRLLALLPCLTVLVVWAALYKAAGYGTHGSGIYLDPVTEPVAFLHALPRRFAGLTLGLLVLPISSLWYLALAHIWASALAAGFFLLFGVVVLPLVRRDAFARFWGLGMLLSTLPACTAGASDRLLLLPGVGALALVAALLGAVFDRSPAAPLAGRRRVATLALSVVLVAGHLVLSPVLLPVRVVLLDPYNDVLAQARQAAYSGLRSPRQDVVVLNAPDYYFGTLIATTRAARHEPMALHTRVLYGGFERITVRRPGPRVLTVEASRGFLESPFDEVYRSFREPMHPGQGLQLTGAQIVVERTNSRGEPTLIEYRSAKPLEESRIIAWNGSAYARFTLPPVGGSRVVPNFDTGILGLL